MHQPHVPEEAAHATTITYVQIAAVLFFVTLVEVGVFYVEALRVVLAPLLLTLSATKFALVAMFYMHLRYDRRLLAGVFVVGLLFAAAMIASILVIMGPMNQPLPPRS